MNRSSTQVEPADLVARILAGESRAETELYERYRRGIAMILGQMMGARAEAEDLSQETFRLALEKIRGDELRDPRRLPQFLNSLARNLAIQYFRKQTRRRTEGDPEAVEKTPDTSASPYDQVARREKAVFALQVLREMANGRDREILYRFYIADEDKAEICRDLDLPSLHFNRVLFRAKKRYRDLFEKTVEFRNTVVRSSGNSLDFRSYPAFKSRDETQFPDAGP